MAQHNELGRLGENAVVKYLQDRGYTLLEQNWFYHKLEVDIIARNKEWIIFVEVKTRASDRWGNPEEAVSKSKMRNLVESADYYMKDKDLDLPARFDVAAVILGNGKCEIEYFEDAFFPSLN